MPAGTLRRSRKSAPRWRRTRSNQWIPAANLSERWPRAWPPRSPRRLSRGVLGANDRVRIGVIGAGQRGSELLHQALACPNVEIAAFADVYTKRLDDAGAVSRVRPPTAIIAACWKIQPSTP